MAGPANLKAHAAAFWPKIVQSFCWIAAGKFLSQLGSWAITIWVARLVSPGDYGLMALAALFVAFGSLVNELGLGAAIVRSPHVDATLLRKALGAILALNSLLCCALMVLAPLAARAFQTPALAPLVRLMALHFVAAGLAAVPQSVMERDLDFRRLALVELAANLAGAGVSLALALAGHGVWALALGALSLTWVRAGALLVVVPLPGPPILSLRGMDSVLRFGGLLSVERILWYLYSQADVIIAGRMLGAEALGLYTLGKHLASLPSQKLSPILNQILLPAFARIQRDSAKIGSSLRQGLGAVSIAAWPVFVGIAAVSPELVTTLLGDTWAPAVLPMQIYGAVIPFGMLSSVVLSALKGIGRVDLSLGNVAVACVLMPTAFLVGSHWGLLGLGLAWAAAYPIYCAVTLLRSSRALGTRAATLAAEIWRPLAASGLMLAAVLVLRAELERALPAGPIRLAVLVLAGAGVYAGTMLLIARRALGEARAMARSVRGAGLGET